MLDSETVLLLVILPFQFDSLAYPFVFSLILPHICIYSKRLWH